jgi:Peptidase inhibitor I9
MFSFISLTTFAAALSLTLEHVAPASAHRLRDLDSEIENSYIVKLKDSVNSTSHINSLPFPFSVDDSNSPITYWWPDDFKGYSGVFVGAALDAIMASPDVEYVEKNGIVCFAALSLTLHILNHAHRLELLLYKPTQHGTSKPSAPESLSRVSCTQ